MIIRLFKMNISYRAVVPKPPLHIPKYKDKNNYQEIVLALFLVISFIVIIFAQRYMIHRQLNR